MLRFQHVFQDHLQGKDRSLMSARPTLLLAILAASFGNFLHADDWWQFRGPGGNGDAGEGVVPTKWGGVFDKPFWATTIPGHGWSSPVVVANRIWITTSELVALDESQSADKIAKRPYGDSDFQAHASVKLFAIELNADKMARYRERMRGFYYDATKYGSYLEQLGISYPTVRKGEK